MTHPKTSAAPQPPASLQSVAERYVKLLLAWGQHDADAVDAYYGPENWSAEAKAQQRSPQELKEETRALLESLDSVVVTEPMEQLRRANLLQQLHALATRLDMVAGKKLGFDAESQALYAAVAPQHEASFFDTTLRQLDELLPKGTGPLVERLEAFRMKFVIPPEKLDAVFSKAIEVTRARTRTHIALPAEESFRVEYVTNKPWSGYNWYQGGYHSVIQVNTELPIFIERAVDLAAHEGYPGHHVYNVLLERDLLRGRGWVEFSIYALFSPQSLIAEGSANYGVDVVFPKAERLPWEQTVLFPLAGLPPELCAQYYRVLELVDKLGYASNEAARDYLDGKITQDAAVASLVKYSLMSQGRAEQRLKFIEKYRSYVINYNLGKDLVAAHVARRTAGDAGRTWAVFEELLSVPGLPATLLQ